MQNSKWINQQTACEWLGVSRSWLTKNRAALSINFSYLGNQRALMYDRESIEKVLEKNSVENLIREQTR